MDKIDDDSLQKDNGISNKEFADKLRRYARLCKIHAERLTLYADSLDGDRRACQQSCSSVQTGLQRKQAIKKFRKLEKKLEKLVHECQPHYGLPFTRMLTRNPINPKPVAFRKSGKDSLVGHKKHVYDVLTNGLYVDLEKLANDRLYNGIDQTKNGLDNET